MNLGIRILSVQIKNIKNAKNGIVEFDSKKKIEEADFRLDSSDVIGIYGPNGSSKTSMVNAIDILKKVIISQNSNKNVFTNKFNSFEFYDIITSNEQTASIEMSFFHDGVDKRIFFYEIKFIKNNEEKKSVIINEKLTYKQYDSENQKWSKESKLIEVDFSKDLSSFISPLAFLSSMKKIDKNIPNELVLLRGISNSKDSTFIFSDELINILLRNDEYKSIAVAVRNMKIFAIHNMHVYNNKSISQIAANDAIPFFYKNETENLINTFVGRFNIFGESKLQISLKNVIYEYFQEIDIVINKIIPNMRVKVVDLGNTILDDASEGFKCEVVSIRNDVQIPLRLESDGIKKIISLISAMVDVFNNKYSILIVDEFDSGIFEFLLGEILISFKQNAKGQLLFTSHNLRALEVIKESIIFSSIDENDRYISYPRISDTGNLRSQYIKRLFLDDNNKFAEQIDIYDIYRAFVKAGELINHE